jgi:hypothetical protein
MQDEITINRLFETIGRKEVMLEILREQNSKLQEYIKQNDEAKKEVHDKKNE